MIIKVSSFNALMLDNSHIHNKILRPHTSQGRPSNLLNTKNVNEYIGNIRNTSTASDIYNKSIA